MKRILLIVAIFAANAYAVEPNLVAWWQFDEASGTIAYDSAGANNGTVYGGATWTSGEIYGALSFNGTSNYVDCGSGTSNCDDITISAWMQTSTQGTLVSNRYGSGSYGTWYTLFSTGIEIGDNSQGGYRSITFNAATLDGLWHHVVYTKNGTDHKIYVDGSLDQNFTSNADISNSNPLFIGKRWTLTSSVFWFNGILDDVRIYNEALSAEEIEQIYQEGLSYKATNPYPAHGTACLSQNTVLSWRPGKCTVSHDVYFGTNFNEVNEANTSDTSGIYRVRQDANNYDPFGLEGNLTYYWRIDEVNDSDINSPWTGDVWSFTTIGSVPPASPAALIYPAADGNNGRYQISWSAVEDADGYKLERSGDGGASWMNIYIGAATSFCDDVNTGNYRYRVCANSGCDSDWTTGSTDCAVVLCFPISEPNMTTWKSLGKPRCWCYQRQCKGDGDGLVALGGGTKVGYWYVGAEDLTAFTKAFLIRELPKGPGLQGEPNICYDLDHVFAAGYGTKVGFWRVGAEDLTIFAHSFLVKEPPKGSGIGTCPAGASGSRYTLPTDYKPCN